MDVIVGIKQFPGEIPKLLPSEPSRRYHSACGLMLMHKLNESRSRPDPVGVEAATFRDREVANHASELEARLRMIQNQLG